MSFSVYLFVLTSWSLLASFLFAFQFSAFSSNDINKILKFPNPFRVHHLIQLIFFLPVFVLVVIGYALYYYFSYMYTYVYRPIYTHIIKFLQLKLWEKKTNIPTK
ncbi:hypothetical protein PPSC2_26390 (plasmid) [Paenibacillus polymyxa SC2]|uniref:Uncharacterized protein n=1 Tax=Paenibacillus polymyxa (strain SC2) TaxID=886882 RepID=A0A0D5ZCV0_PAEPS|nr:hypothetical protein PPSC2_26390 [Paenibacillus polymyxa SC2]